MTARGNATVLVTGSNGFVGSAVTRHLTGAFSDIHAGTRRRIQDSDNSGGVRYVACDLEKPEEVRRAVAKTDIIVHAAYSMNAGGTEAQCRRLLEAMTAEGAGNLVHLSSIAVYGEREGYVDESMAATSPLSGYALEKRACEKLVHEWVSASSDRRAIVLRPGIIYGTGSAFWIDKLGERIRSGAWGTFGIHGDGHAALVHVDDVADIVVRAASMLASPQRSTLPNIVTANVVGPEQITWNRYFAALATAMKRPPLPQISASVVTFRQGVASAAKAWRRLGLPGGRTLALAPTRGEMKLFGLKACYATDALERLVETTPKITLESGLARTQLAMPVGRQATSASEME